MTYDMAEEDTGEQRVVCWLDPLPTPRIGARIADSRMTYRVSHMKHRGTRLFWIVAVIPAAVAVFLAPVPAQAEYTYDYSDDFTTDKAQTDSYIHSIFWPEGAYPPAEAYLYQQNGGTQTQLGFASNIVNGEPAYIGYCFPSQDALSGREVFGSLHVTVRLPYGSEAASPGYLYYRLSSDGINWENPEPLGPGLNDIPLKSVRGACYVIFFGTEVLIDNLNVSLLASPATIRVPQDAPTIQEAIDAAADGDIVEVARGTYAGDGNRDIDFRGKAITVRSADGPGVTTIECGGHRGFYFHSAERPDYSILRGFTIIGGAAPGSQIPADNVSWISSSSHPIGGGIFCEFSSPSIIDCVIRQCSAELGGGIGVVNGQPVIINCTVDQCRAGGQVSPQSGGRGAGIGLMRGSIAEMIDCTVSRNVASNNNSLGGGLYCWRSRVRLTGCDVSFNNGGGLKGGGLYAGGSSIVSLEMNNCIVSNNTAEAGSGVYVGSSTGTSPSETTIESVRITNCTLADNKLSAQATSSAAGGIYAMTSNIEIRNSIVWSNSGLAVSLVNPASSNPVLYCDIQGGYLGQGNIELDPLFASSAGSDYHLKSRLGRYESQTGTWVTDSEHSPCIDAGDPLDPIGVPLDPGGAVALAEPLTNGKRIDMGAYGGTIEASKGAGAFVFHVDIATGRDSNTGLSRAEAFATIQRAVDEAISGDTIMVWPGYYRETVILDGKAVTLQSAGDAAVISTPYVPNAFAFSFYRAESSGCVLRNFVITGCGEAAIFCYSASPTLANLTITANVFGIRGQEGANPDVTNCIIWNNQSGDLYHVRARYSDISQADAVGQNSGNISTDPLFADPANGDYHLKSRYGRYLASQNKWVTDAVSSPCIDAGDPSVSPGRERMPRGGRINMGAYGGTPFASLSGWPTWSDTDQTDLLSENTILLDPAVGLQQVLASPEPAAGTPAAGPQL